MVTHVQRLSMWCLVGRLLRSKTRLQLGWSDIWSCGESNREEKSEQHQEARGCVGASYKYTLGQGCRGDLVVSTLRSTIRAMKVALGKQPCLILYQSGSSPDSNCLSRMQL